MEDGGGILVPILSLAITLVVVAGFWKAFVKAGHPGWAAIVPIYNMVVMLQIAGRPMWWILLMFIPFVNIVVFLMLAVDIARAFGKGTGFGLGLFLFGFVFWPILGFGDAEHLGAAGH